MTDSPTNLYQNSVTQMLDFVKTELDAGRMTALSIVAVSQDKDVFREIYIAPNGTAGYTLIGGLDVQKSDLHKRFFSDD